MEVTVGTFNLNNLFSRFNFQATVDTAPQSGGGITLEFTDNQQFKARTFMGKLVKGKDADDTQAIANRILMMDVDVLAVQEVEHIEVLKAFNRNYLDNLYPHIALVEGNDQRMIDVAVLSKLPFGAITSYQAAVHPDAPSHRIFGRDLLSVEILDSERRNKLFTLYNTHLKSHFVPFYEDPVEGAKKANQRRLHQAEMVAELIAKAERPDSRYILTGDMNDPPNSNCLTPMLTIEGKNLFNALSNPIETRPPKAETQGNGPQTSAWTYRHNPHGPTPPEYRLIDQIWLSEKLAGLFVESHVDRRTKHGGDGSDHDPVWIKLDL